MTIENCAICGRSGRVFRDWSDRPYIYTGCNDGTTGPSCDDEETAIRYWNAMQRGLKMEVEK